MSMSNPRLTKVMFANQLLFFGTDMPHVKVDVLAGSLHSRAIEILEMRLAVTLAARFIFFTALRMS